MNKELEEAIQQYKELKRNKNIVETIEPKYFFEFADIMLNYIENSISKETIKEKIEKIINNNEYLIIFEGDTELPDEASIINAKKYIKMNVLQEILEEK